MATNNNNKLIPHNIYQGIGAQYHTITIDGPAGAGKGVVSTRLAQRLGFTKLDTGAMYRAVALYAIQHGISMGENMNNDDIEEALNRLLPDITIEMDEERVILNGQDVSQSIRSPEVSMAASFISRFACVRQKLTQLQRRIARHTNIVAEGRDMGTVVFPDALCKFFLTATPEIRAQRRWLQLQDQGRAMDFEGVLREIRKRDEADSSRAIAPLTIPPDAMVIDSSHMTIDEVVNTMYDAVQKAIHAHEGSPA